MCQTHEARDVAKYFARVVSGGYADHRPPPCFNSYEQWAEYGTAYILSKGFASSLGEKNKIDYCRDCNRNYKGEMLKANRCSHPETVFIKQDTNGDVVGVSIQEDKKSGYWEKCMMGVMGTVVGMPPAEIIDSVLTRLAKRRAGGRPKKEAT